MDRLEATRVREDLQNGNFVFVKVRNRNIRTLIDTGAHFSCISLALIRNLHLEKEVVPAPDHKKLFTANGKILGTILLSVNIQGLIIPFTFYVLEQLTHKLIIGINFLTQPILI